MTVAENDLAIQPAATQAATAAATLRNDPTAWDGFVAATEFGFHTQLSAWATVKQPNGWRGARIVADGGSGPIGAQVLVRRLGPGPFSVGYAPRGPVTASWDEPGIAAFTAAVRKQGRRMRLSHVTIEPPVEVGSGVDVLLRAAGWKQGDPVQPDRTWEVPLGRPEAELWAGLRSKWRQYVSKARRAGTVVVEGGRDDLDDFYAIFTETAERTGFIPRTLESYREVWDAFAPSGRARLLFARHAGGESAAVLFLVRCGGRMVEPYGGMTIAGAASRANYLLKWEAIRRSNEEGARVYDMWGMAHAGIEQFKQGFGGREAVYIGAFDLPTVPLLHRVVVAARRAWVPLARRIYHARHPGGPDAHDGASAPATNEDPATSETVPATSAADPATSEADGT